LLKNGIKIEILGKDNKGIAKNGIKIEILGKDNKGI